MTDSLTIEAVITPARTFVVQYFPHLGALSGANLPRTERPRDLRGGRICETQASFFCIKIIFIKGARIPLNKT